MRAPRVPFCVLFIWSSLLACTANGADSVPPPALAVDPVYSTLWSDPAQAPAFKEFSLWIENYLRNTVASSTPAALEQGVRLASVRRAALQSLIQSDPEKALRLAIPTPIVSRMPAAVRAQLEARVSGIGDLRVLSVGSLRFAELGSQRYQAFVYGTRKQMASKDSVPLHGISLDGKFAVHASSFCYDPASFALAARAINGLGTDAPLILTEVGQTVYGFASLSALSGAEERLNRALESLDPRFARNEFNLLTGVHAGPMTAAAMPPGGLSPSWSTGIKKVLIIRVDFPDKPGEPSTDLPVQVIDATEVDRVMQNEVIPFYAKSSWGKVGLEATAPSKLYRATKTYAYYSEDIMARFFDLRDDIEGVVSPDYHFADFDRVIFVFAREYRSGNAGWAEWAGRCVWINGRFDGITVAHELGHTFGLNHANLWYSSSDDPLDATGKEIGYMDVYDPMGMGGMLNDFNAHAKNALGWVSDSQVRSVTDSGTFRLYAFDFANTLGSAASTLALKVRRSSSQNLWLSIRRNLDPQINMSKGLYVQLISSEAFANEMIADLGPINDPPSGVIYREGMSEQISKNPSLQLGKVLVDSKAGVAVELLAIGGTAPNLWADVKVTFGDIAPVFNRQPASVLMAEGHWQGFSVLAQGIPTPVFQWQCKRPESSAWENLLDDGATVQGCTSPNLAVLVSNSGMNGSRYRCLSTNTVATAASDEAILEVTGKQQGLSILAGRVNQAGAVNSGGSAARFGALRDMAGDSIGNLYLADSSNHVIRRLTAAGMVSTFAGSFGDGQYVDGPSSSARLCFPFSLAVDRANQVYFFQLGMGGRYVLRKVAANGSVQAVAGREFANASIDGVGPDASFAMILAMTCDGSGNVYGAERDCIRRITPDGVVTTLAGVAGVPGRDDGAGAVAHFDGIRRIAAGPDGSLYVVEDGSPTIRKVTASGQVSTWLGAAGQWGHKDGAGSMARFEGPSSLAFGPDGVLYIGDGTSLRRASADGEVATVARDVSPVNIEALVVGPDSTLYLMGSDHVVRSYVVPPATQVTMVPAGATIATGATAVLWVGATGAAPLTYQWYEGESGDTSAPILAATGSSFTTPPLMVGSRYWVRITSPLGSVDSATVWVQTTNTPGEVTDFNGDGHEDLLWQNSATGERKIWLLNGTAKGSEVSLGAVPVEWQIAGAADLNGDGKTDIVWQNSVTGERTLWLMNGLSKTAEVSLGTLALAWQITATADFNDDGHPDLLWQNAETGERYLWFMNGTALQTQTSLGTVSLEWQIAGAADFNADGGADILWQNTTTGERGIWLMNGASVTGWVSLGSPSLGWWIVGLADLNGDGMVDILWENIVTDERAVWLMNGTTVSSFVSLGTVHGEWSLGCAPRTPRVPVIGADFNSDSAHDLLWENTATGERALWLMDGTTQVSSASLGTIGTEWITAGAADFNGDRSADIVWENTTTGERYLWLMDGTNHLSSLSLGTVAPAWHIVALDDFSGDRRPDLLWENTTTGERYLWLMDGSAASAQVSLGNVALEWHIAGAADFNTDGKTDIVWENRTTGDRYVWLMDGTTHLSSISLGTVDPAWQIAGVGDYNADAKPDLVWENSTTGERYVWLMNGTTVASAVSLGTIANDWKIVN